MPLNADTLLDRLYLKSQITKWRVVAVALGIAALVMAAQSGSRHAPIGHDHVARITLEGFITDDRDFYDLLDETAENPRVKGVILWIDTPGGNAVGGEEIYNRLRRLAHEKPVVAVMRSIATSAGYMAAIGTDYIVAREGTITGSIGVLIESAEFTEMAEKLGITPLIIKSSPLKGSPNPLEKTSPEAARVLQTLIDDFHKRFTGMVETRRSLTHEQAVSLADGRVFGGRRALDYKLIDALGGEETAMEWLVKTKKLPEGIQVRDVEKRKEIPWLQSLTESIAGKFFYKSGTALDGLISVWHPELH